MQPHEFSVAVRAFPEPVTANGDASSEASPRRRLSNPKHRRVLIFDTETRIDETQRLTFGSFRYLEDGKCLEEGLFYADDLSSAEMHCLRQYVETHSANVEPPRGKRSLTFLTLDEFLKRFYITAYKGHMLVVGFNLPFDLSRLAVSVSDARKKLKGGFSFSFMAYMNKNGKRKEHRYRPRLLIKAIDSKRSLIRFAKPYAPDEVDRIPDDSPQGKPEPWSFQGYFLDLRTLAFALTDSSHSLASACETFGVEHGKMEVSIHGTITEGYIDYNRRDVLATSELYEKLSDEYAKNPVDLPITQVRSPASVGKAYLGAMRVVPILERQPDFPRDILGFSMSAFFGGRTSTHIRRFPVPIVYTDFLSMYPTVNSLMHLWSFWTAAHIDVVHDTERVQKLLNNFSPEHVFIRNNWSMWTSFVQLDPQEDILPARATYDPRSKDWQVGVNYISTSPNGSVEGLWYALPDVLASILLTGKVPQLLRAFTLRPVGKLKGMKPVLFGGKVLINPKVDDFFRVLIEQRKTLKLRDDITESEQKRLDKLLKVVANSTSYGCQAEMTRYDGQEAQVRVFGADALPFDSTVQHSEEVGKYCFPPLASLITSGARLMLAALEHSVNALGGTYAMEDTDSMAIVATEHGGLVECPGGPLINEDGRECIKALSWQQSRDIVNKFAVLNPYDASKVSGSILKIEDDNFHPQVKPKTQRQIYCYAISAKRYARFILNESGEPEILQKGVNNETDGWSEHGFGHLLNPTDPESLDRDWIRQVWLYLIRNAMGLPTEPLSWFARPALSRISVSSAGLARNFRSLNKSRAYARQVKPFNFMLSAGIAPEGHPIGADPNHFHLIAPYEPDPRKWDRMLWIDRYSGKLWPVSTRINRGTSTTAKLRTYGDVIEQYAVRPESKCADQSGRVCERNTIGLLQRRHITVTNYTHIGKESNRLDEVEAGLIHNADEVYTEYKRPDSEEWRRNILPKLCRLKVREIMEETGLVRSSVQRILNQGAMPHRRSLTRFMKLVSTKDMP